MTKVKICGITNLEDALLSVKFGADALGFNFYERSPRYVSPSDAESIVERMKAPIIKFGVFVNETIEEILDAEFISEIDVIQLHGDETPEFVARLRKETDAKIVKAFRVSDAFDIGLVNDYEVDAILLDSFSASEHGGTGNKFDWELTRKVAANVEFLYLAGGLNPNNVADAIKSVQPFAVDVASGVELSKRKKDPKKLEAFIKNAKDA